MKADIPCDGPEHGIDEPGGASLPGGAGQPHRLIHRGVRRHALQKNYLVDAEPKDLKHDGFQCFERTRRVGAKYGVERGAPADDTVGQVCGQALVFGLEGGKGQTFPEEVLGKAPASVGEGLTDDLKGMASRVRREPVP